MKIGLVLEGGANRGVFTSGVLDYFMEQDLGKAFRYVIGTSAGAGNAMNFISGQHGRSRDTTITKDKRYAYFGLKNIIRTGHLFDMENIYWRVPTEYNLFDFDAYFRNPIEREYTATNCLTGQAEYLTDYGTDRRYLMNIGMASSALPAQRRPLSSMGFPMRTAVLRIPFLSAVPSQGAVIRWSLWKPEEGNFGCSFPREQNFWRSAMKRNILPLRRQCAIAPNDIMLRLISFTRWKRQAGSLSSALSSPRSSVWRRIIRS